MGVRGGGGGRRGPLARGNVVAATGSCNTAPAGRHKAACIVREAAHRPAMSNLIDSSKRVSVSSGWQWSWQQPPHLHSRSSWPMHFTDRRDSNALRTNFWALSSLAKVLEVMLVMDSRA